MEARMKSYDVPHKGLRNALSQLSLLAGKTDFSEVTEIERLSDLGKNVFKLLTIHALEEDEVTLAELENRCPGCSIHDREDHAIIHIAQEKLEKLLASIVTNAQSGKEVTKEGAEFYLAFSEFHAKYLEHTAEEERITQVLIWKHFTDEELFQSRSKIMARIAPETLLLWFTFILPAQSHTERVGLLSGFKKAAPAAFFAQSMEVIKAVLLPQEYTKLTMAIDY